MPSVGEHDLLAGNDRHHETRQAVVSQRHFALNGRDESRADILGMSGTRAEVPSAGEPVTTVNSLPESVGEELAAGRDAILVLCEDLFETLVGQVGGAHRRRGEVGDPDPPDRPVLAGQLDPGIDHLREARLAATGRSRIGPLHESARPQRLDHPRAESPLCLRFGRLLRRQGAQGSGRLDSVDYHR